MAGSLRNGKDSCTNILGDAVVFYVFQERKRYYMKIAWIIALFLIPSAVYANKIDKLTTKNEVERFVKSNINSDIRVGTIFWDSVSFKTRFDDFGTNTFYKLDIDNNGLTDLVIDGNTQLVILDKGNSKYKTFSFNAFYSNHYQYAGKIKVLDGHLALLYKVYDINLRREGESLLRIDTLIYKFDELIEYTANPEQHRIHQISLSTLPCFGSCPVFDLEIDEDGTLFYSPTSYTDATGSFIGKINKAHYTHLVEMLNYLRFARLQDEYSLPVTDLPTAILKVIYDDNHVKVINDYGEAGTRGLSAVYDIIEEIRRNHSWKSWLESSIKDSVLVNHPSFFNVERANDLQTVDFIYDSVNSTATVKKFSYETDTLFIKTDSTFVLVVNGSATIGMNLLSIGKWTLSQDTIAFYWDGIATLKAVRNYAYARFFSKKIPVRPLRIDGWKFRYLPGKLGSLH